MHMRPRPAAGLQPTAAVLRADRNHGPFSRRGGRSGRWRLQMPIGGQLIGMTDAQGHGFVIAAARNLERQRQSDLRCTVWRPPRLCVAVTVRASYLSRAIERPVGGAYELQCGDRSNDLNKLPKASCRHRNTLLVVLP